ncbi:hypothetical protein LSH36_440g01052 [Paralvinella palmiformis]|uniref:Uncharacterized protein n=1 Tax=Paralvinella palmiformis TaxID=53620 RepID=A0AAD9JAW0_9ANNE|nr:hypothetical protein LSH36_440g01052 [Paralvinella palmiformis]
MKCAGRNDADIKCLLAIYRTEEIRNHRLGRETVDSCNEIELMLPKTRCPEYLTIRLLSTKAAGYDLSNDSTSSIHCYHQAAQLAVLTKASMASAYSLIMYAIHGLLHRRIDHETMAIPNDNTWKEAEYYVAWGLEQHRRWISWLNEDPHISEETVRYFQSSTLLKYGFVLIRTCIQGDPPLLATVFPLDITQLRSAKCCLAEIICHFVEFSVRGTVAVNFLACDLCIRHSQRCLATNHDNAIVWLKQAFRHAHRAKFACGKMVDKQHAHIGYRFTLKRLQFIEKTLVGLFAKCSSSFRCAEHSPDDEYLLTLPLLERTSLGTEQERYIGDDLLQLERGYKVTILPTPSEEQRIEPKRLYSPRTATLIGHKDSHEFQNPDDPLHSVSNGDLAQTRPKQPLDGDAHVFSSAIHLDSCREQESISPAHPAPSASLHHPTRTHPKQILDPDEHVFNLPITSEDLRAQVIRLSTDVEEQTLPKCPTGESAENDI